MPVRDNKPKDQKLVSDKSRHEKVEGRLIELGVVAADYLRVKKEQDKLAKQVKEKNTKIKQLGEENADLFVKNGAHREVYAPLGDGVNEIFIQFQHKESVSLVSNAVDLIRQKLGKKADNYIMTVEVLHENALQAMRNAGLITDQDILDLTVSKSSESLIVKANKKK